MELVEVPYLATYATYTTGDIIGTAVDLDSAQNKIYFL